MPAFISLAFTRWRFYRLRWRTSNSGLLFIYWEGERLSWPGWLTSSGRFTHISGHWSPISWRSSVRQGKFAGQDCRSCHCDTPPTPQTVAYYLLWILILYTKSPYNKKWHEMKESKKKLYITLWYIETLAESSTETKDQTHKTQNKTYHVRYIYS